MKANVLQFLVWVLGLTTLVTSLYVSWWLLINVFLPVFVVVGAISLVTLALYKLFK